MKRKIKAWAMRNFDHSLSRFSKEQFIIVRLTKPTRTDSYQPIEISYEVKK